MFHEDTPIGGSSTRGTLEGFRRIKYGSALAAAAAAVSTAPPTLPAQFGPGSAYERRRANDEPRMPLVPPRLSNGEASYFATDLTLAVQSCHFGDADFTSTTEVCSRCSLFM